MLQCDHPLAITFQMKLPSVITLLCTQYSTLLFAIDASTTLHLAQSTYQEHIQIVQHLLASQQRIGWSQFLRGFLSLRWRTYLKSVPVPTRPMTCSYDSFFQKLIVSLWTAQTEFWMAFQEERHHPNPGPNKVSAKHQELRQEVEYLFSLKPLLLAQHADIYLPDKPTYFLETSMTNQLKTYIVNYGAVIKAGVREAKA